MIKRTRQFARLKQRELQGTFLIAASALRATQEALPTFRGPDGDHEGIVFLAGRESERITILLSAVVPQADHGPGHVACTEKQIGAAARAARSAGLGLLAQVHSHPGSWTEHLRGDDDLVLMPFEGMLSIVVPHYSQIALIPLENLGVHQFQRGRWQAISPASIRQGIKVVPDRFDLR